MQFRVLGPLEVVSADGTSRVAGRKERAVLAALLVHHGRALSAGELVAAVWGDDAPPTAEKSLQVRLSHLRAALRCERPVLVRDGRGYRLDVPAEDVDALRFAGLVDAAAREAPEAALERYERALALVRGRPYADVDEFDGLDAEIRRLDELRLRAVEGRLRALLDLGRHAEALPELERIVRDDPHHEGLTELLMLALYRAGRQVEALEAYRRAAEHLLDLGLAPSERLRRLEADILAHEVAAVEPAPSRPARRTNLSTRLTSFVGREAELAELVEQLRKHRLVTLTGPGGVGKTSLAVEAARALIDEHDDGVWLVGLAPLGTPDQVPAAIADALPFGAAGPSLRSPGRETIDVLGERLAGRRTLLVLDDCEHLATGVGRIVERLLAADAGLRVLATSRQALGAQGEAIVELRPFAPHGEEALQLFADRARAVQPAFRLDAATRAATATICERLDGLPLALELAAARTRALSVEEIAARLDDRFALLGDARMPNAAADGEARAGARTLGQVVDWSFGLLPASEQELFCRLAVFRARFTLDAAERVAGGDGIDPVALPDLLVSLVDRSMVSAEDGRYRILETLREFGLRRLEERGGLEACRRCHRAWAAGLAGGHANRLYAEGVDAVGHALAPHRADLDAAIDLALEDGAAEHALPLATGLGVLDFGLGDSTRSRTRLARALRLDAPTAARVPDLTVQSPLLTLHGLVEQGVAAADQAIALAADEAWTDRARAFRGSARVLGGDVEGALEDFDGLEDRLTMRGELWVRGFASGWLGFVRMVLGELVEAERLTRRAVQAFERCDDVWGLLTSSVNLARVEVALGAYDDAAQTLGRALRVGDERVPQRVGPILHDLGLVELRRANFERAAALWRRCTELADLPANSSGWVLLSGPAERWYGRMAAGHLARMDGDEHGASARYAEACALLEGLDRDERHSVGIDAAIATALLFQGGVTDPSESRPLLRRALSHALDAGDPRLLALVLDVMAGRAEDAVRGAELFGAAERVRTAAGGPLPTVEQRAVEGVALALRTELGDEAYEAAVARGRSDPLAVVYTVP